MVSLSELERELSPGAALSMLLLETARPNASVFLGPLILTPGVDDRALVEV